MREGTTSASERVFAPLAGLFPDLEALHTDLHAHPELSTRETRTAGTAAERLRQTGFAVTQGVGGTGVIGCCAAVMGRR